ncbi:prepilin peptidase, partial [Sphingomonas solaris]
LGAIGLWLGWRALPPVLLGASLIGLAAVLVLRLAGRRVAADMRVPLGTLLALAAMAMWLARAAGMTLLR